MKSSKIEKSSNNHSDQLINIRKTTNITWKALQASIQGKTLLHSTEGYCKPGQMLAIMGPSGAGKTTLLSLLSARAPSQFSIKGQILANSQRYDRKAFYRFGAYVYQNDLLHQTLTVRQTLLFSANLKIQNKQEAKQVVEKLIQQFELQKCADSRIGGKQQKGISGGEKKRVCIAIQMVSTPSVIILDEPTSGLDSNKSAKIIKILSKLSKLGHTIIFTLHQPSYLQYQMLDRLILLKDGKTIYQGKANLINQYMKKINIKLQIHSNISDFFMMEISQYKAVTQKYETPFTEHNYSLFQVSDVNKQIKRIQNNNIKLQFPQMFTASFFFTFKMLFIRDWMNFWRNKMRFGASILNTITRILLIGYLFSDEVPTRQQINLFPQIMFIKSSNVSFLCITSCVMTSIYTVALSLPAERQLYYKENDSKKYSTFPYFLSKVFINFFAVFLGTSIYCAAGYWMNGWTNEFQYFLYFYLINLLMSAAGNSLGFFCSTLFKEMGRVTAMTSVVLVPLFALSGLFNKLPSIPVYIRWLHFLSPFMYGYQLVIQNEYRDQIFSGYEYGRQLGFILSFKYNILALIGLIFGYYLFSYIFLKLLTDKIVV